MQSVSFLAPSAVLITESGIIIIGITVHRRDCRVKRKKYEKLLYQINPHFLLNTLNSVQWMAQMSRQRDISEFVHRLSGNR